MSISSFVNAGQRAAVGNHALGAAGLSIDAGAKAQYETDNSISVVINGVIYACAADTGQAFTSGHPAVAYDDAGGTSASVLYVIVSDSSGTLSSIAGTPFTSVVEDGVTYYTSDATQRGSRQAYTSAFLPSVPDTKCPVGVIKVAVANTYTFTPGTTLLDAAGMTATFYDVASLPYNVNL